MSPTSRKLTSFFWPLELVLLVRDLLLPREALALPVRELVREVAEGDVARLGLGLEDALLPRPEVGSYYKLTMNMWKIGVFFILIVILRIEVMMINLFFFYLLNP